MEGETHFLLIFVAAILTNNILLSNFLGMCSFLACSKQIRTALGLGEAVVFVTACTAPINWGIYHLVLAEGARWCSADLTHLSFITFIAVIAAFVQLVEMIVDKFAPRLYMALGIFLPLITVNCAILGACLFMIIRDYSFVQSVAYGVGSGVGWALAIVAMAGLRKKMAYSHVPKALRGVGVTMIVTGLMAMAFMGFAGMVNIQK